VIGSNVNVWRKVVVDYERKERVDSAIFQKSLYYIWCLTPFEAFRFVSEKFGKGV
jgi:hypothetical protein